jgi:hypothetical protein
MDRMPFKDPNRITLAIADAISLFGARVCYTATSRSAAAYARHVVIGEGRKRCTRVEWRRCRIA